MRNAKGAWGFGPSCAWGAALALALVPACDTRGAGTDYAGAGGAHPVSPPGTGGASSSGGVTFVLPTAPPFLDGQVQRATYAAPISGGTLLVTKQDLAVAADPDRDRVFLVDLPAGSVRAIPVGPKDELGRVVEGPPGFAYVLARRGGALLALDLAAGPVQRRVPVCAAPRGLAYDATAHVVHVACRSGLLLTLAEGTLSVTRRLALDPDLRDVLVSGPELVVTRFKSAEVLVLDAAGTVTRRASPPLDSSCSTPTVLYRAVLAPGGAVYLAHQTASNGPVNVAPGGYGVSCSGGISSPFVGTADLHHVPDADAGAPGGEPVVQIVSRDLPAASGPLDVAVSADGRVAVLATGNSWSVGTNDGLTVKETGPRPALFVATAAEPAPVTGDELGAGAKFMLAGEPTAIAFDTDGHYVAQSREPATLELEDGTLIPLSDESHADTGLALFHVNTGIGLACASCHPEGDEDGHTWHFASGYRRTQPLAGGITARAPFHWTGNLPTLPDLVDEVMLKRMALATPPTAEQIDALGAWLDTIPPPAPPDGLDAAAVERGRAVFESGGVAACSSCHSGPQFSDGELHDVGTGGAFETPTLLGVGSRTPLLHDGCAKTLADRFGLCGGGDQHGDPSRLTPDNQADLIEFLRSL